MGFVPQQGVAMTGQPHNDPRQPTQACFGLRGPFRRLRDISLTARSFLLVCIAVLPAIGIQAYNEYDLRTARAEEIRRQCRVIAAAEATAEGREELAF